MTDPTWRDTGERPVALPVASADWAYFLDFDGTLVDLAPQPDGVQVDEAMRTMVQALWSMTSGAVAIVSGRSIAAIDGFLRLPHIAVAGQHGAERRGADGVVRRVTRAPDALDDVRTALRARIERHPALLLEDKGLSLALHYRQAPPLASFAHQLLRSAATQLGDGYTVQGGKRVVELKPADAHKGAAIRAFLGEAPFRARRPVFAGDDRTDEDGFAAVNDVGGLSVKVGPGRTAARFSVPSVRALRAWLTNHTASAEAFVHPGAEA